MTGRLKATSFDPRRALIAGFAGVLVSFGSISAGAAVAAGSTAVAPAVRVTLSPQEIRVGDLVEAVLRVEIDAAAGEPAFPNWQGHWGGAEIRDVGAVIRSDAGAGGEADSGGPGTGGRVVYSQTLVLTSFRPGAVTLPSESVKLPGDEPLELFTEPATFEVGSVLPAGEEQVEARPPAPPRPMPLGELFWWTAGLLSVLTLAFLALLLARRRTTDTFSGVSLDPWDALEAALARLAVAADAEAAFTGLSLELRRYLGRTLVFPAAESTTTELRLRLLRSGLPHSVSSDVVRLLVEADSVKFARKNPAPNRVQECLEQARAAANEVRRFVQPEDDSEKEEEAA